LEVVISQLNILNILKVYPQIPTEFDCDGATSAIPIANILEILGGNGIDTSGAGKTVTITAELATTVNEGIVRLATDAETIAGTLAADEAINPAALKAKLGTQTVYGIAIGNGTTNAITWSNPLINGQLLIGATGLAPVPARLTSLGSTITITNYSGGINLEAGVGTLGRLTAEDGTIAIPAAGNINIVGTATNGINTTAAVSTMTISMASPYADDNFTFLNTAASTPRGVTIQNTDGDGGSSASLQIEAHADGGDSFLTWSLSAATRYFSMGIDNSDNNYFKFTHNVNPSAGNNIFRVDPATETFTFDYPNVMQTHALVAGGVNVIIQNTDNTNIASDAFLRLDVGGAAAGDPFIAFLVTAAGKYAMGIDNTDNDYWKFTDGNTPSDGTTFALLNPTIYQWQYPVWEIQQQFTRIGDPIWYHLYNLDNTNAASNAFMQIETGGATGGDPYINFLINGLGTYSVGIDNTDSDKFKITATANPSAGSDLFTMTSAGVITLANDLDVTEGGTGVSTLTSHGILMGNAAGDIQATAEPTDGQLLIGKTGDFPQLATLASAGGTVAITNGAGTINLEAAVDYSANWMKEMLLGGM
jgi:hypothetical protein